ncbi:MAG TPA: BTAD domain-containing putative transcriptional regulator [Streptosporangiaceae bacterium]
MRFQILGPVEFWTGQAWAAIGAPKWRSLLATLLINAGQVVSTDRLIQEIWGDKAPAGANNLVSIYALRLRRLIGDEHGLVLRTRAPGYQIILELGDLDAAQFDALVREARQALADHKPEHGSELLTAALALWKGGPLIDVPRSPLIVAEAERLEAAKLDALELRIEADIGCGRNAEVIPELFRLVADHPIREGFWGLLMQALDGAGRHAEALTAYQRAKEVIAEELGVDPGEQLQGLYQEILTRDLRQQGTRAGQAAKVGYREQAEEPPAAEPAPPMQLPIDISDFTGRAEHVARLCELQPGDEADDGAGAVMVALVTGAGGLGKTTLAVHAAHRLRSRFPDGQLYVDLLGVSAQPQAPADVLARFLRDLGVDGGQIPVDEEERAALFRTRLTGRRVLILLDNARDYTQVRPLLPGSSSCAVLVTSRKILADLVVAAPRRVDLDVLDPVEARALFSGIVGAGRAGADAKATGEVLAACAGLPLAIRIAGAWLAARPKWEVGALATRLRGQHGRLDVFKVGDLAVRTTFEVSFADLPPAATSGGIDPARAFRLLGLWEGPVIGLAAAAALFGQPGAGTGDALEQLVDVHLLESPAPDVFRFHDLLREYAHERSAAEPEQARRDATVRILSWYLHTAEAAARTISPNHARVPIGEPGPGVRPLAFGSLEEALDWSETERASLVAATRQAAEAGLHDIAWQLPAATMSFFYRRSHWADWVLTHELGLASARTLGDRLGEARMLNNLGMVHGEQRNEAATGFFEQAAAIYRELGDRDGEARAMTNIATAWTHLGRFNEALEAGGRSLVLQRELGRRYGEGITLSSMGWANRQLGKDEEAIACLQDALTIFRELGDEMTEADALGELGDVHLGMGRLGEAMDSLRESLGLWRRIGDRHGQAMTLQRLGKALHQAGRLAEARESLCEAQRISEELGDHKEAEEIRSTLAKLSDGE